MTSPDRPASADSNARSSSPARTPRRRAFARMGPYLRAHARMLLTGGVFVVLANWIDVRVLVLLGDAIDFVGRDFGPFAGLHSFALHGMLLVVVLLALMGATARFAMRWLIVGASRKIEFDLRNDLFRHVQRQSAAWFGRMPTGDLMNRSTSDIEAVRLVVGPSLMYVAGTSVMLPLSLWQMIHISGRLTLATWAPLLLLAPLFYFFSSRIHVRFTRTQETFSEISARVQETLAGIRVVKACAIEDSEADRFERLSGRYVEESLSLARMQALFMPLMQLVIGLSLFMLVGVGGAMIASGELSQGRLISFFVLLMSNIWPLAALGWVFSLVERGSASMKRIDEIFEARVRLEEPEGAASPELPGSPADRVPAIRGRIEVRDLTFAYPGSETPALRGVTFTLEPGRTLGLTGPVGSGKSTLATLLARRYDPPRGTILVDGRDILELPVRAYRSRVGVVDQEPFLFSESIRSNLLLGLEEADPARREEIAARAARIARLEEEVAGFPDGYETMLGERGINLSGGQRQRAAIARALAVDPAILILDDALSAVDTRTEEEILSGLREFMKGRTTILVSHRASAMSLADRILYLEDGAVVEDGSHEELMARGGRYRSMALRQRLAEEIEATA